MPNYEARIIRGAGLLNLTVPIDCIDDSTALRQARLMVAAHDVQVWRDGEIIGTLHRSAQEAPVIPKDNVVAFRRQ